MFVCFLLVGFNCAQIAVIRNAVVRGYVKFRIMVRYAQFKFTKIHEI